MSEEKKSVTVRELQTFIEAVEFAADTDNWVPSERQWKRIREMIDNLAYRPAAPQPAPQPAPVVQYSAPAMPPPQHQAPVRMAPGGMPPPPSGVSGRPAPFANPAAPSMPVKTPDIDTSSGGYESGFA